jgi:hypothetical protein
LRQRLIEIARHEPPVDRVPWAFEKRIMSRLLPRTGLDPWSLWNRILWRCAAPCVALTLLVGGFAWYRQHDVSTGDSFAADLETVLYAPITDSQEVW